MGRFGWVFGAGFTLAASVAAQESLPAPAAAVANGPSSIPMIVPTECVDKPLSKEWTGNVDFGMNGTSGNSENFNLRLYAETKRERPDSILTSNILYTYANTAGTVTVNRALLNAKNEWLFANSPWSYFVSGGAEYDEFRAFDLLIFGHTGLGYTWIKDDSTLLKTRGGFGGSYPIGGPDEQFTPEALLGLDYERRFNDRAKLVLNGTVFPDISNISQYRAETRAALEFVIDPIRNIGMKIGAVDRYVSNPQGRKHNDVEYFTSVMWKY